jgi:hypothetical protein
MARVESINDEGISNQTLNKIQRKKVREIVSAYSKNPADAFYHVTEYCSRISKFAVSRVTFENPENPTGIQIHTSNSVYLFAFNPTA